MNGGSRPRSENISRSSWPSPFPCAFGSHLDHGMTVVHAARHRGWRSKELRGLSLALGTIPAIGTETRSRSAAPPAHCEGRDHKFSDFTARRAGSWRCRRNCRTGASANLQSPPERAGGCHTSQLSPPPTSRTRPRRAVSPGRRDRRESVGKQRNSDGEPLLQQFSCNSVQRDASANLGVQRCAGAALCGACRLSRPPLTMPSPVTTTRRS